MVGDFARIMVAGRISVFAEPSAETRSAGKKGGEWVYATHDLADGQQVLECIQDRMTTGAFPGLQTLLDSTLALL